MQLYPCTSICRRGAGSSNTTADILKLATLVEKLGSESIEKMLEIYLGELHTVERHRLLWLQRMSKPSDIKQTMQGLVMALCTPQPMTNFDRAAGDAARSRQKCTLLERLRWAGA